MCPSRRTTPGDGGRPPVRPPAEAADDATLRPGNDGTPPSRPNSGWNPGILQPSKTMTHSRPRSLLLLTTLAAGLVAACGGDTPARLTAAVDTVDGVEQLRYPAESATPLDWSLDTTAVLGDAFAEDVYQFDGVNAGGLTADGTGNLYVLDRQGKRVLKYAPDGQHLATFGREGEGPGELSQPISLAVGPGDTVWVSDFSNTRFTGYPQDGGDPRTIAFPEEAGIPGQRLAAVEGGFLTSFAQLFFFRRGPGGGMNMSRGDGEDGDERTIPVLHTNGSLEPLDTLWKSVEPPMDMVRLEAGGNVMITMMSREFYPDLLWDDFSDGGIVVSDSVAYALHLLAPDGGMVRTVRRAPGPRPTTEADRELARDRQREEYGEGSGVRIGGGGLDPATQERLLQERLEKMTFADLIPRVVALRVDPSDRIWVGVSQETPGEVDRIDIYQHDGALIGELRDVPFPDVFLGSHRIGVLRRDELDVQQLVLLDIGQPESEVAGE